MKVQFPEGSTSASVDGIVYEADEDGCCELPTEHGVILCESHGFTNVVTDEVGDQQEPKTEEELAEEAQIEKLHNILLGTVAEVAEELGELSDDELAHAEEMELGDKDRVGVHNAIAAEQAKRKG